MARWLMQARSTSTKQMVTWRVDTDLPDYEAEEWPGPGAPEYVAATKLADLPAEES